MKDRNLPPPPVGIEDDIPLNQMNSQFCEYSPMEKSDYPEDDKYFENKYKSLTEVSEDNIDIQQSLFEYSEKPQKEIKSPKPKENLIIINPEINQHLNQKKHITINPEINLNEVKLISSKEKIKPNQGENITINQNINLNEENIVTLDPKYNYLDEDNEDNVDKEGNQNSLITDFKNENNNIEKKENNEKDIIPIVNDIKIPQKKSNFKCNCDCNCFYNCDCDCCECCDCDCDCCDCYKIICCECCECTCLDCCDKDNHYKLQISFIILLIQNIIYLICHLCIFVDYNDFSFRLIITPEFFYIMFFITGTIFVIIKYLQFRNEFDTDNCEIVFPSIITLIISFFKGVFFFGIWSIFNQKKYEYIYYIPLSYSGELLRIISIVYIIYFSFSIIYYFTLIIFVYKRYYINYVWFFIIGILYIVIANFVLYLITSFETSIYGLIICSLEIVFLNFGIGISLCRDILKSDTNIWNIVNIEIYKLYPLLIIASIPGLTFLATLALIYACCARCRS